MVAIDARHCDGLRHGADAALIVGIRATRHGEDTEDGDGGRTTEPGEQRPGENGRERHHRHRDELRRRLDPALELRGVTASR